AYGRSLCTRRESPGLSSAGLRRPRFRFGDFFSRLWRRLDFCANTRPLAVTRNRLADPLCVLSLGIHHDLPVRRAGGGAVLAGAAVLAGRLFGREHHRHLPSLKVRWALDVPYFCEGRGHLHQTIAHQIGVDDLPPAEAHVDLDPVAVPQEALSALHLHFDIVAIGLGAQAQLLDDRRLLLLARLAVPLRLLVLEAAEIHQPADGRLGLRGDFHQVEIGFLSHAQGLPDRHDTQLLAVGADHADFPRADLVVDTPFAANRIPPPKISPPGTPGGARRLPDRNPRESVSCGGGRRDAGSKPEKGRPTDLPLRSFHEPMKGKPDCPTPGQPANLASSPAALRGEKRGFCLTSGFRTSRHYSVTYAHSVRAHDRA